MKSSSVQVKLVENEKGEKQLLNELTFRPTRKDRLLKAKRDVVLTRVVDSKALEGSPALSSRRSPRQSISNSPSAAPTARRVNTSTNLKDSKKGGKVSKDVVVSNIEDVAVPSSNTAASKISKTGIKNTKEQSNPIKAVTP